MEYKPYQSLSEFKMNEEEIGFSVKVSEKEAKLKPTNPYEDIFQSAFHNPKQNTLNRSMPEKPSMFSQKRAQSKGEKRVDCSSSVVLSTKKNKAETRETFNRENQLDLLDEMDGKHLSINDSFQEIRELVSPRNNQHLIDQQYEGSLFQCLVKDLVNEDKSIRQEIQTEKVDQPSLPKSEEYNSSVTDKQRESENSYNNYSDRPTFKTKLKNFKQLFGLLVKIFTSEQIDEEDIALKKEEFEILNCIIFRKFMRKLPVIEENMDRSILMKQLSRTIHLTSHKRPEECNKFIFTRVLRFLKKKMKVRFFKLGDDEEEKFYQYYFADVSQKNDVPIEQYYYPLTRKGKNKETLNVAYFTRIFESKRFVNDLLKYMTENLREEYEEEIKQKLESILMKWDKKFNFDAITNKKCLEEVKAYFIKNKRCKLPWNIDEVKEAILRVQRLIEMYGDSEFCINLESTKLFD